MTRGGNRKGAGRKPSPIKRKKYGTVLRLDLVEWLKKQNKANEVIEKALDLFIERGEDGKIKNR